MHHRQTSYILIKLVHRHLSTVASDYKILPQDVSTQSFHVTYTYSYIHLLLLLQTWLLCNWWNGRGGITRGRHLPLFWNAGNYEVLHGATRGSWGLWGQQQLGVVGESGSGRRDYKFMSEARKGPSDRPFTHTQHLTAALPTAVPRAPLFLAAPRRVTGTRCSLLGSDAVHLGHVHCSLFIGSLINPFS